MALLTPSESGYITSFLSAVDLDSSINPDGSVDQALADRVPHLQGREALSKATKDLMSLDVPPSSHRPPAPRSAHPQHPTSNGPSYWPSFSGPEPGPSLSSASSIHKYGSTSVRSSSPANYLAHGLSGDTLRPVQHHSDHHLHSSTTDSLFAAPPHLQIAPLRGLGPSASAGGGSGGFVLPPISTAGLQAVPPDHPSATSLHSPASLPSASSSAKRPLPPSSQPATDPSLSKRPRPSPSGSPFPGAPSGDVSGAGVTAGASRSSSRPRRTPAPGKGVPAPTAAVQAAPPPPPAAPASAASSSAAGNNKGALLSPSQKRANHIQSEQKRRANIRRGYEALCEVVPALREAIRAEEERERQKELEDAAAEEAAGGSGKGKAWGVGGAGEKGKKKKGKAESEKQDGRAGPRSENVVLQKTIDYITDLIAQRTALQQRLELARGVLPLGHPATAIEPRHLDGSGIPLWEREWNGGMDLDIGGEGSDDDS